MMNFKLIQNVLSRFISLWQSGEIDAPIDDYPGKEKTEKKELVIGVIKKREVEIGRKVEDGNNVKNDM